jgi:hypothetical protein
MSFAMAAKPIKGIRSFVQINVKCGNVELIKTIIPVSNVLISHAKN